jgi:hypothetical protein
MKGLFGRIKGWPAWAKVVAVVVALLVVAGGVGAAALVSRMSTRGATKSAARHAVTVTPQPSEQPTAGPPSAPLASTLTCRLPVSSGQGGSGGFVTFPQATFAADPASAIKAESVYGLSFDRSAGTWVPVPRSWVSPDGSRYAYWDWRSQSVEALTIATGAETTLGPKPFGAASAARVSTGNWTLIEALDGGVYAAPGGGYQSSFAGLWLFPWSGAGERQVIANDFWQAVGGGAAWGTVSQSVPEGAENTILRLDLAGGSPVEWFSRPRLRSRVVGFDASGHPVVEASSRDVMEVWLVVGQGNATSLLTLTPTEAQRSSNGPGQPRVSSVVGDDKGIWLATTDGTYLSAAGRTEKVSTVTGQLGGGCA